MVETFGKLHGLVFGREEQSVDLFGDFRSVFLRGEVKIGAVA